MAAIVRGEAHGDTDRHAVTAGDSKALPLQAAVKVARDTHHFVSCRNSGHFARDPYSYHSGLAATGINFRVIYWPHRHKSVSMNTGYHWVVSIETKCWEKSVRMDHIQLHRHRMLREVGERNIYLIFNALSTPKFISGWNTIHQNHKVSLTAYDTRPFFVLKRIRKNAGE